jgi:hypothetical protein
MMSFTMIRKVNRNHANGGVVTQMVTQAGNMSDATAGTAGTQATTRSMTQVTNRRRVLQNLQYLLLTEMMSDDDDPKL